MSRSSGIAAVVAAVLILCVASARAAAPALGPAPAAAPAPAESGLNALTVAHRVLDVDGGSVTAAVPSGRITLDVPPEALRGPTDVRLTTASAAGVDGLLAADGLTSQRTVAAVGLKAYTLAGDPLTGSFAKPLTLTMAGTGLGAPTEQVVQLNLPAPQAVPASLAPDSVRVLTDSQPDLAVVAPKGAALRPATPGTRAAVPASMDGARSASVANTVVRIGKPPSPQRLLGAVALSVGTALAVLFLHRRRPQPRV